MKMEIKSIPQLIGPPWWQVIFNGGINSFPTIEGAHNHANKVWLRYRKEQSAFSMLNDVAVNLLDVKDIEFVQKLLKTKCAGITKAQYGYLKGIHERQKREW